jgi:hypothetical protein
MSRFAMIRTMYQPKTSRELLLDLGVGQYNATMLIETLMMAPATTEAAAAPTMLLVGHIQEALNAMGSELVVTGYIDKPTAQALAQIAGPMFLSRSWFDVVKDVVAARRAGIQLKKKMPRPAAKPAMGLFDLPDVPGGIVTYAAGGLLLWHLLKKKRTSP